MFIIGNPEDTRETIIQSIEYAKYLPSLYSQFSVFTPYPGTPAYNEFKDIVTETKLENFNQYNLTFKHKNLTQKNISDLKSLAYFKFYLNFKKIFQVLKYFIRKLDIDNSNLSLQTKKQYKSKINVFFNSDNFPDDIDNTLIEINKNGRLNTETNNVSTMLGISKISQIFRELLNDENISILKTKS